MYENIYDVIIDLNDENITCEEAIDLIEKVLKLKGSRQIVVNSIEDSEINH